MIRIYHNPRCTKSRQGIALLKENGAEFEEIRYIDKGLNVQELESIVEKLGIKPIELVRKNEVIWKSEFKNKNLSDDDIFKAMVKHPRLMERPVVINGNKGVIGRPTNDISTIL